MPISKVLGFVCTHQDTELLYLLIDSKDVLSDPECAVIDKVLAFFRKFDRLPEKDELDILGKDWSTQYYEEVSIGKDVLVDWWKAETKKLRVAAKLREAAIALDSNNPEVDDILLQAARLASREEVQEELRLSTDWEKILQKGLFRKQEENLLSTGIRRLDRAIGGLFRDDTTLIMAPSNRGKTMFLAHIAYHAVLNGLKVLAVTLEIPADRWGFRVLQRIGLSGDVHYLVNKMKPHISRYIRLVDGECIIRWFPARSLSIAGLEGLIERYSIQGYVPDLVIVDYLEEMQPGKFDETDRGGQRGVAQGLCNLSKRFNIHVMSATQTNKEALNKLIITEKEMGQNYGKYQVVDGVFALCQTEDEYANNQGRIYVCKWRNEGGRGAQIPLRIIFAKALFEDINVTRPSDTSTNEEVVEVSIEPDPVGDSSINLDIEW